MARKFIPDGDHDFEKMAFNFAGAIERDPARYSLSADDAAKISEVVQAYRKALPRAKQPVTRTKFTIGRKERLRAEAERVIRAYGRRIRADESITVEDKATIGVREHATRCFKRNCPDQRPFLEFVRAEKKGLHILEFRVDQMGHCKAKPRGAVRVELFVEMVEPGRPIPSVPGDRPWYLRSYTTSPMKVEYPMPRSPKVVVYWIRWADAKGNVGPFSSAAVAGYAGEYGAMVEDCAADVDADALCAA